MAIFPVFLAYFSAFTNRYLLNIDRRMQNNININSSNFILSIVAPFIKIFLTIIKDQVRGKIPPISLPQNGKA